MDQNQILAIALAVPNLLAVLMGFSSTIPA
jgi:hypothetical protein